MDSRSKKKFNKGLFIIVPFVPDNPSQKLRQIAPATLESNIRKGPDRETWKGLIGDQGANLDERPSCKGD